MKTIKSDNKRPRPTSRRSHPGPLSVAYSDPVVTKTRAAAFGKAPLLPSKGAFSPGYGSMPIPSRPSLPIGARTLDDGLENLKPKEPPTPFAAGTAWFIRTVTYHLVGIVTGRYGQFLTLKAASWVADSGRFTQAIKEGELSEVESVGEAVVNLDSIVDAFPWVHPLPAEQK